MPYFKEQLVTSPHAKSQIMIANLKDNPYIAVYYFYYRFTSFLKTILKPKFSITKYQFRYKQ